MIHQPGDWKVLAWQGLHFKVPSSWEIAILDPGYLLLESDGVKVLELKWSLVKGRFNAEHHLKRLATQAKRASGTVIRKEAPTREWHALPKHFTVTPFTWKHRSLFGRGAVIFCPHCQRATLVQFFYPSVSPDLSITRRVLSSFEDHSPDQQTRWTVFDIQAVVPAEFKLLRHRFQPGAFELVFKHKHHQLSLYRWGAASALMAGSDLETFATKVVDSGLTLLEKHSAQPCLEGSLEPSPPKFAWLTWLPNNPAAFKRYRMWHVAEKNRILAVNAQGRKAFSQSLFDQICDAYEPL